MEIELIIKIGAIGIIVAVINQILARSGRDDYAMFTTLAGIVIILMLLIPKFSELMSTARSVFNL